MKTTLLSLISSAVISFGGFSQAELTITAPTANTSTTLRAPNGTTAHTTVRGVIIIPASELASIPPGTTITKLSMLMNAGATPGPAGGNIQFYLENTGDVTNLKSTNWATVITPMTSVYNGPYSVPDVAGPTADVTLTTGFVYTGGSVYAAYDYLGSTFTTTAGSYSANNSITGGWLGQVDPTTTPPATLGQTSSWRPCFNFTFTNPFTNELNVAGLAGEKGILNRNLQSTQTVTSFIANTSQTALTNVPVTLTVTGANPYTNTQTVPSVPAGGTETVLFTAVPSDNLGAQTLTVSIPADQLPLNNSQTFDQQVQCDTISYAQSPVQSGGVGFNTGAGLIANRHEIPSGVFTNVKSVSNYFPNNAAITGNTLQGFLLDGNGVIIDSTSLITTTAAMLGTKQDFDFLNGAIDVSGDTIYVGFRQSANATTGYFPFANQDNSYVDPIAAVTFPLFGGAPAPLGSGLGYMMIDATLTFDDFPVPNSSANGVVCLNSTLDITPQLGASSYEFFVDGASVQSGPSATYTTGPLTATTTIYVEISNGACPIASSVDTITVASALINNLTVGLCPGQTFTLGTQTLSTAGSYTDTLPSVAGCDSIINLTLTNATPTTSTLNESICQGQSFTFGTQTVSTAGTYTEVIQNAAGCDSTITLNLTVNQPTSSNISLIVCENVYQFGTQTLTTGGTYTETFQSAAGCDSVVTLDLTLNPPISVTAFASGTNITATASASVDTYQWIDCATNDPVAGATSASFDPTANGSYAVIVGNPAGCIDTSNCATVSTIGLDEQLLDASIQVYPNPAVSSINIISSDAQILSYVVTDMNGREVTRETIDSSVTEIELSLESISEGTYILEVETTKGKVYKPFVKK
ncbi:MAG: T9SS type A sorting domain-containing protein [Crocinitomicaceae bacterium]|nr:T9SS type A sorting domain-containing protein [Crocinitomicaceae bacterium]